MKRNKILDKIRQNRAKYVDIFVDNSFDLSKRIEFLMEQQGIDQKTLAQLLNKKESEISKWMCGSHNFTLKTLAKIEDVLKGRLFEVCSNDVMYKHQNGFVVTYHSAIFNCDINDISNDTKSDCLKTYKNKTSLKLDLEPIADLEPILIN